MEPRQSIKKDELTSICPRCEKQAKDKEEADFIKTIGVCYTCDEILGEVRRGEL